MADKIYIDKFATEFGTVRTAATEKGLALIMLPGSKEAEFKKALQKDFPKFEKVAANKHTRDAKKQISAYLNGRLTKFTLKLDIQGTDFQKKALKKVAAIPFGKTKTYGDIAKAINSPNASRAVGSANATNRLPLVIPCHRVVATTGLGGYAGGLKMKKKLLDMETVK